MGEYNILVLDEDIENLSAIEQVLKSKYNIFTTNDVDRAFEMMKTNDIHLIITEQDLKKMSGIEFLEKVSQENFKIAKIILTHSKEPSVLLDAINKIGVNKYIIKPWDSKQLEDVVKSVIESSMEVYKLEIENKEMLRKLKENYSKTIFMLATMLEAREKYVHGHSERVAYAATCIARRLNLPQKEIDLLYSAGLLHDIGRIGVPEAILHKTEDLNEEDWMYIRAHTSMGERILASVPDFIEILPIVRSHHERIDGKGYPDGLKGEEIPLLARIIAVVDTFDAITSERCYRLGKSFEEAIKILEENKGTQLDAKIVDVFVKMLREQGVNNLWELE